MSLKLQGKFLFGDFQVDLSKRAFLRAGQVVPLGPKTFDLLVYLVGNAQRVITKEELLEAVWPNAHVEESNLSQHVFLLRKALTTTQAGEKLIVTVPGRGYQFTPSVMELPANATGIGPHLVLHAVESITRVVVEEEEETDSDFEIPAPRRATLAFPAPRRASSRRVWWGAGCAALVLAAVGGFLGWRWLHPRPTAPVDSVLVELDNRTGDADFDGALQQAIQIDLEQSPYVNLLSADKIRETLVQMQQPKTARLTPAVAREVCERNNAELMLSSVLSRLGNEFVLMLTAESCVSGKQIAGARVVADSKEKVLTALDSAASQLRRKLGESSASLERFQVPIEQATTSSLEALRAYSQGMDRFDNGDEKGAQTLMERAVALDPNFAFAYNGLGVSFYNRGDNDQAISYFKKAYDLRSHTSEREGFQIEILYAAVVESDFEQAVRSEKAMLEIYPQDAKGWGNLCNLYTQLGQYPQAIAAGQQALRTEPHARVAAEQLARALKRANRFGEAKQAARLAIANGRDSWGVHSILFQIAIAEDDATAIKSEGEWGLSHQHANQSLADLGYAAATAGRLRESLDDFSRSRAESLHGGDTDYAQLTDFEKVHVLLTLGEPAEARALLLKLPVDPSDSVSPAIYRAETGDLAAAKRLVAKPDPNTEKDTVLTYIDLPMVRAEIALKEHRPLDAIRALEPARPFQLRDYGVPLLRARAETDAGLLDQAIQDYQTILDNRGIDPIAPGYPSAQLGLARLLAHQGKVAEAAQAYKALFKLWRSADPDLAPLVEAKREFASLGNDSKETIPAPMQPVQPK